MTRRPEPVEVAEKDGTSYTPQMDIRGLGVGPSDWLAGRRYSLEMVPNWFEIRTISLQYAVLLGISCICVG